jgi:hypothetical protein
VSHFAQKTLERPEKGMTKRDGSSVLFIRPVLLGYLHCHSQWQQKEILRTYGGTVDSTDKETIPHWLLMFVG